MNDERLNNPLSTKTLEKRLMMSHQLHYLVNLCHSMDDVPMGLFSDVDAAFEYARELDWEVPAEMYKRLELPACSTPVCVTVTTFRGNVPISRVVVRDFEDEGET